jgi:DNA-binding response OmpR family regulator
MKFVIIEDSPDVVESLELCVSIRWPDSTTIATAGGRDAIKIVQREAPDVVILDLALADMSGFDVLREIREFSPVPLLIVSARADEVTRVKGLELGADDYLVKPFSHTELLARVQAVVRRVHMVEASTEDIIARDCRRTINLATGRLEVDGKEVVLSATEWRLLSFFVRNAGKVIGAETFAHEVWGVKYVEASTIKMFVRRLRLKLRDDTKAPILILSHRGRGYSFEMRHTEPTP